MSDLPAPFPAAAPGPLAATGRPLRLPKPPVLGARGVVACGHPLASGAALEAFRAGGNAVDAAMAAAAALWVVLPDACGIGGDALLLVRPGDGSETVAFNGAGAAPSAFKPPLAADGGATVAVPGAVAACADVLARFGRLELAQVLAPAIALAEDGFPVGERLLGVREAQRRRLERTAGSWGLLDPVLLPGARWRQPELARALRAVAERGPDAFYGGQLAEAMATAVQADAGWLIPEDLAAHRTTVRAPVAGRYRDLDLALQPPASQALLALLALRALENHEAADPSQRAHLAVEAIEAAFAHRDEIALPDAPERFAGLALELDPERARHRGRPRGASHTTAVATADAEGTIVSGLVTVFHEFGSGVLVSEGGFCLTDRALSFSTDPASPNAAAPGRKPVHTLSPALLDLGRRSFALATPGADGQVQTLVQVVQALVDDGLEPPEALAQPRWRSSEGSLELEDDAPTELIAHLRDVRGHRVELHPAGDARFGAAVAVGIDRAMGTLFAVPDPRQEVHAAAW